jgi:NAD(P)-dependent dehydrogenase (short-subunit alcohol dehydrogenase family)
MTGPTDSRQSRSTAADSPKGRVALVTGASRGIGAAAAIALARRGISPVLAVRDAAAARPVAEQVERAGAACRIETCDVADAGAVAAAVRRVLEEWKRIDIVVNNAGQIDPIGHVGDTDPAGWARAIGVNLLGPFNIVHACLPALQASSCATVLNVSSGAAHHPREGWSAYCSAKAGLAMLTRSLDLENRDRGVAAFGLQPGVVDTDMQVRIRGSGMNEVSRIPRGDLAPPDHAAALIAWLCDIRPAHHRGKDLSIRDAGLVAEAGLAADK